MKKFHSLFMFVLVLSVVLAGCAPRVVEPELPADQPVEQPVQAPAVEVPQNQLPSMTTENITLTFARWGLHEKGETEARDAQLKAFMEEYPNITVESVNIDQGAWAEGLYTLAAAGTLPDVFWVFSVTEAVMNGWALDTTEFFDMDMESEEIFPRVAEIAKIDGRRYMMPTVMFPHVMFMNKTLFEKYDVPMPSYDWTVDEFIELAKELSHPADFFFGTSNPLYPDLFDAWYNGRSMFGWDGESFHIGEEWIRAMNMRYEFIDTKVLEWMSPEEKEKVLGDPNAWPPGFGRSAMHIDWPWTKAYFFDVVTQRSGHEFTIYPLPKGPTGAQMAIVDFGVISAATQHPRESWELQKWTSWGADAALIRQKAYREVGAPLSRMPVITNEEVWADIIENAPNEDFKAFYARLTDIVPSPWSIAPGWGEFFAWAAEEDIWGKLDRRELKPADIAVELNTRINEFKQQYLETLN